MHAFFENFVSSLQTRKIWDTKKEKWKEGCQNNFYYFLQQCKAKIQHAINIKMLLTVDEVYTQ